ncbi:hypothetical protein V5799_032453 [Amblyomma americanum]|uniref:MADF domain-containing protein n=1 Tax=Amblyomma americanum TaxID=6943 RepID=A0AAQ4DR47_AMBAM
MPSDRSTPQPKSALSLFTAGGHASTRFVTVDVVQGRWRNLKDTYRRKLRDIQNCTRSGAGAVPKSKAWIYLERMHFLKDQMDMRQ